MFKETNINNMIQNYTRLSAKYEFTSSNTTRTPFALYVGKLDYCVSVVTINYCITT
jgi:hypothetical protein